MAKRRIGGTLSIKVGSTQFEARGSFQVSGFHPAREGVAGLDGTHGYTEKPQVAMIEGEISTISGFKLADVQGITDAAITLSLANETAYGLFEAWETGEGVLNADEGSLPIKFQGMDGEQIR